MPAIGVIDDREDVRQVLVDALDIALHDWEIVASGPLPELQEYPSWLGEQEISVLIVDEKLNESTVAGARAVDYLGHNLVEYLRQRLTTLPIFVVTSWPDDPSLAERFGEVEDIIDRQRFPNMAEQYASRFARASERYTEALQQELSKLSDVAQKLALGESTSDEEITEARAIQQRLNTAFSVDEISDRHRWIKEMEDTAREMQAFQQHAETLLEKVKNE